MCAASEQRGGVSAKARLLAPQAERRSYSPIYNHYIIGYIKLYNLYINYIIYITINYIIFRLYNHFIFPLL